MIDLTGERPSWRIDYIPEESEMCIRPWIDDEEEETLRSKVLTYLEGRGIRERDVNFSLDPRCSLSFQANYSYKKNWNNRTSLFVICFKKTANHNFAPKNIFLHNATLFLPRVRVCV